MRRRPVSAIQGIFYQLCPRCREGKIFRRSVWLFPPMHERCPACGLKFEREAGYFLGAMYISYGLGLGIIAILSTLVWEAFQMADYEKRDRWSLVVSSTNPGSDLDGPRALDLSGPGRRSRP